MPVRSPHREDISSFSLVPFGAGGLDEFTHESLLGADYLPRLDNARNSKGSLERRLGDKKIAAFASSTVAKTFGADSKYGTIPAAAQLETLDAGFAIITHFEAARPGAGNTAYIISSRVNGQTYHVFQQTIDENGALTTTFEKRSGGACTVTTSAITDNALVDVLALFDPVAGTFTVYVDGASSGTPVTGLTVSDGPIAGSGTNWHVGAHYNPATAGIVADTHFDGRFQGPTILSLRGTRPASGATTLANTLIRHSSRIWPAPQAPNVLAHYDCQNSSTTVFYDSSRHKNHGTLTGTPTNSVHVAVGSVPANFVGYIEGPSGRGDNLVAFQGRGYAETVKRTT